MDEEIVIINHTKKTLKARLVEQIEYKEKRVNANDFRVFNKDIQIVERKFKVLITEENEEQGGEQ